MRKKIINPCSDISFRSSPSTFKIPELFLEVVLNKIKIHKGFAKYVSHLIRSYRFQIVSGVIEPHSKVKTLYQEEGQNLIRFDFRPIAKDWAELKCLRFTLNCSMSLIFVFLLKLDLEKIPISPARNLKDCGHPTFGDFTLVVKATLDLNDFSYNRFLYLRPG